MSDGAPPATASRFATTGYCQPGRYYSLDWNGQVRARSQGNIPGPAIPSFPLFPQNSVKGYRLIQANALGIAPDGTAYALGIYGEYRYGSLVDVWIEVYKRSADQLNWEYVDWLQSAYGESWVAGGVDPYSGEYYFGRFTTVQVGWGQQQIPIEFILYRINADGKIEKVGNIKPQRDIQRTGDLSAINGFSLNGDLSFDVLGNLHILAGHAYGADIWTVSRERLDTLNGGTIRSDTIVENRRPDGAQGAVGAAFDTNGWVWIATASQHFTFNPTTNEMNLLVANLNQTSSETDLASCQIPPTLSVKKVLSGPRFANEQFMLSVDYRTNGSFSEYTAPVTTAGSGSEITGGVTTVVVAGATYRISESVVDETEQVNADMYESTLSCVDQNGTQYAQGDGTITIPSSVFVTNDQGLTEQVVANMSCTLTNTPRQGSVSWSKVDDSTQAQLVPGSQWRLNGPFDTNLDIADCVAEDAGQCPGPDKDPSAGKFMVDKINFGTYTLSETKAPTGYEAMADPVSVVVSKDVPDVHVGSLVNTRIPGEVTWQKVDNLTPANRLAGSVWTLTGPLGEDGAQLSVEITDCVADTDAKCAGPDKDHSAGGFRIGDLAWGDYVLSEKQAPAGYSLDEADHAFMIKADQLAYNFDQPFVNLPREAPTLPLTGGLSRDHYALAGVGVFGTGLAVAGALGFKRRRRWHHQP